jgi:hypothetical protein
MDVLADVVDRNVGDLPAVFVGNATDEHERRVGAVEPPPS